MRFGQSQQRAEGRAFRNRDTAFSDTVEQDGWFTAAKRRKNAAHGASRGFVMRRKCLSPEGAKE
jgi:hypothetical protein